VLVLWDIDGTLLQQASREHADSLLAALRRVHRIEIPAARVEAAGRTDGAIARSILLLAGVSAERIDDRATRVCSVTCEEFARRCPPDLSSHVAPGVPETLEALAGRNGFRQALVTGNFEPVARLKLQRAGIGHYFPAGQGAYGSDSEDRAELPSIARERAGRARAAFPRERTVVIGDTPLDIACARADGVHVIAIATGPFTIEALHGADAIVERATDVPAALDALAAPSA
jgi:phosphoglycolate phosphatase-like HAD superfamily hydrolase